MLIGIPREPNPEQTLVAGTPDSVKKLIKLGYEVVVESGAGEKASYFDDAYEQAGESSSTRRRGMPTSSCAWTRRQIPNSRSSSVGLRSSRA